MRETICKKTPCALGWVHLSRSARRRRRLVYNRTCRIAAAFMQVYKKEFFVCRVTTLHLEYFCILVHIKSFHEQSILLLRSRTEIQYYCTSELLVGQGTNSSLYRGSTVFFSLRTPTCNIGRLHKCCPGNCIKVALFFNGNKKVKNDHLPACNVSRPSFRQLIS